MVLGVTPGLLATLAPSIGEISMLSSQRPFMALLLSAGGPAIRVSRLLEYDDPLHTLKPSPTFFWYNLRRLDPFRAGVLSTLQYMLAAAAIANVAQTSWQLGLRTVVPWRCNSSYLPFLWTTLPVGIHIIAAATWYLSPVMRSVRRRETRELTVDTRYNARGWIAWLSNDFTLSSRRWKRDYIRIASNSKEGMSPMSPKSTFHGPLTVFLNETTGFLVFLHLAVGTLIFSSLQFISVIDAMTVIARYIASGLVCRIILMQELDGLRTMESESCATVEKLTDAPQRWTPDSTKPSRSASFPL